jgi:hypothetical protein
MNLLLGILYRKQYFYRGTNPACALAIKEKQRIIFPVGMFAVLLLAGVAHSGQARAELTIFSKEVDIRLDAGFMYDDNVTRAKEPVDKLIDRSYSANLGGVISLPVTAYSRALITASLGGEKFSSYSGLNRFTGGLQGEYQYRSSAEFAAPIYAAFLKTFIEQYESSLRSGSRYSAGVSIRQPVTDRINLFAAVAYNQRYAKSAVFNITDNSARLNLDYAISPRNIIYMGAEYRRGDTVSTGLPSLENIDIAEVFAEDGAFPGGQFFSYRFKGSSLISTLGYNMGLNARNSLDFSWRMIESKADERPSFATSPSSYIVNQYSLVYLMAF